MIKYILDIKSTNLSLLFRSLNLYKQQNPGLQERRKVQKSWKHFFGQENLGLHFMQIVCQESL